MERSAASSASKASAGGLEAQPWLVKSSITASGRSSAAAGAIAPVITASASPTAVASRAHRSIGKGVTGWFTD